MSEEIKFSSDLPRGLTKYVTMKKTVTERLGKPFNDCVKKAHEVDSALVKEIKQMGSEYRQYFCYRLCQLHYLEIQCKCKLPYQFGFGGNDTCRLDCLHPLIDDFNFQKECDRHCPLECDSTEYELFEKDQKIKDNPYMLDIIKNKTLLPLNSSFDYVVENLMAFHVNIQDLSYQYFYELPKTTPANLVADLGGTLGNSN